MGSFLSELKRRNVIKAAIAYAVIAWLILQVLSIILPNIQAPEWVMKMFTILAIIGFPVWIVISWVYEVTPEGLKKTYEVDLDKSISHTTNKRLNILILVGLVITIGLGFINGNVLDNSERISIADLDNSIAVLPFDDMSRDGDTQWFCDGMTEDILTNLSKIKNLKVISRTSTERYRETDKSIPEIASELGVSYIVEGSVRKFENQVVITAQLINANDTHLWAQNYNDDFKEVFKIQQDVSKKIVNELQIAMSPEEEEAISKLPTDNLDAYNLVLKGRSFIEKSTKENLAIGLNLFKQATELDNQYAEAFAELAYANLLSIYINDRSERTRFLLAAKNNNEIALSLDQKCVRALSNKGLIMTESNDKTEQLDAETYFKKALELNPNDAVSHVEISIFYEDLKKNNSLALYHARRAYELNPLSADVIWNLGDKLVNSDLADEAQELFYEKRMLLPNDEMTKEFSGFLTDSRSKLLLKKGGHWSKAIEIYLEGIKKEPNNPAMHHYLGSFYDNLMNDDVNAIRYFKQAMDLDSTNGMRYANYNNILCEGNRFEESKQLMASQAFQKHTNEIQKGLSSFVYLYHQEKYDAVRDLLKDSIFNSHANRHILLQAQLGNKTKVYELFKEEGVIKEDKAFAFAILKEKDSLYRYLKMDPINAGYLNSRREFDLYRKEPEYIAFMKRNHLPLLETYNGVTE